MAETDSRDRQLFIGGLQVLTACSLASFSLSDCVLSLLGRTMEVIPPATLATFAGLGSQGGQPDSPPRYSSQY